MRKDWGSGQSESETSLLDTPVVRPLLRSLSALTITPGVQGIERDTPPLTPRTQGSIGDVVLGRSRRVWGQGTSEGGVRSRLAAWRPHTTCPRGNIPGERKKSPILDITAARLGYPRPFRTPRPQQT